MSDIPGVVVGWSGKQWDQTWFKVRILSPFENDLISKLREAMMDTVEYNTVSRNPRVTRISDSH